MHIYLYGKLFSSRPRCTCQQVKSLKTNGKDKGLQSSLNTKASSLRLNIISPLAIGNLTHSLQGYLCVHHQGYGHVIEWSHDPVHTIVFKSYLPMASLLPYCVKRDNGGWRLIVLDPAGSTAFTVLDHITGQSKKHKELQNALRKTYGNCTIWMVLDPRDSLYTVSQALCQKYSAERLAVTSCWQAS